MGTGLHTVAFTRRLGGKNEQAEVDEEEVEKPLLTLGSRRERCGLFIAIFDCYVDDNKLLSCG